MTKQCKVYSDDKREATWEPGMLTIHSRVAGKDLPTIPMRCLVLETKIQTPTLDNLCKMGQNPADYRVIYRFGQSDMIAPTDVAEAIYREATRLENEYRTECSRIADLPENKERRAIADLYNRADRIEQSDSEDNVMLPAMLRAEARQKMEEWRSRYPEAARAEDAQRLMDKAADLRHKASGALVYDADGWINAEGRQQRHDDFIREAEELEAQAKTMLAS